MELFLGELKDWGFKKTIDKRGVYCDGSDLYYKNIGVNEYLIFCHYNAKQIHESDFDVYTAIYKSAEMIGSEKPIKFEEIIPSYIHPRDFHLIKSFIER